RAEQVVVANDEELPFKVEKRVDVVDDDKVKVEEKRGTCKSGQIGGQDGELPPAKVRFALTHLQKRQGLYIDLGVQSACIVGEADEAVWAPKVPSDAVEEIVHVVGTVKGPPLHADDVDRIIGIGRGHRMPTGD